MEALGMFAAMVSTAFGGTAVGATRYLARSLDPASIGALRFGGGFLLLGALALWRRERWPGGHDLPAAVALGLLFFAGFPLLFNASLIYTTAARGALALSTTPLLTMALAALFRVEPPTPRKVVGMFLAMAGVAVALASSLGHAPEGAWRGDLLMVAGALCMALYNIACRPFVARYGPIPFAAFGMGVGALALATIAALRGELATLVALEPLQVVAALYLAVVCGAAMFFLWAFALGHTTPTLVGISVALNPVTAALYGVLLLEEPVGVNLVVGLVAVLAGIAVASGLVRLRR